ncbi:MAG: HEAT repeat domain-containing protein [Myxococcota bacterium]
MHRRAAAALSLICCCSFIASLLFPASLDAQRRRRGQDDEEIADAPTLADLEGIAARLSGSPDEVREAIDLMSIIDHPDVIPHLERLLRSGQPDAITDRALEALGGLGHANAVDVLAAFTHHRRTGARRRAYQALAAIGDSRVPALLETGLSDSDRGIRGACALALGEINARGSLDVLFRAFERGVIEAATAIGKLGNRQSVARFTEHLGQRPLAIMLSGYHEFLRRDEIPVAVKTEIVAQLGEVSGPMVRRFLVEYLGTFSNRDRSAIKRQLEETIRRIPLEATGVRLGGENG